MSDPDTVIAQTGWVERGGLLYVNALDLIALLREGDYHALADTFEAIEADERRQRHMPAGPSPSLLSSTWHSLQREHEAGHRAP